MRRLTAEVNLQPSLPKAKAREKTTKGFATVFAIPENVIEKIALTAMERTPHRHPTKVKARENEAEAKVPTVHEVAVTPQEAEAEATALGGDPTAVTERSNSAGTSRTASANMETNVLISMERLLLLHLKRRRTTTKKKAEQGI